MKQDKLFWERDYKECYFESKEDFLWIYVLGGCGCGSAEEISKIAWKVFEEFGKPHEERTLKIYEKIEYEIIAHWLDDKKLTEHGTSVCGSWLSDSGRKLYETLLKPIPNNAR